MLTRMAPPCVFRPEGRDPENELHRAARSGSHRATMALLSEGHTSTNKGRRERNPYHYRRRPRPLVHRESF